MHKSSFHSHHLIQPPTSVSPPSQQVLNLYQKSRMPSAHAHAHMHMSHQS
jgi:hypothetical protein